MVAKSVPSRADKSFGIPVLSTGLVLGAALVLICAAFVLLLLSARVAERDKASMTASNLSAALTQDIARSIELYDIAIQGVIEGLSNSEVMATTPAIRQLVLFDRSATAPYLGSLAVIDEHGDLVLDSSSPAPPAFNYADRAYFKAQESSDDLGLYISEPFRSKRDHEWVINLSRRINKLDGTFGGVVAGTLRLDYLHALFARMQVGPGGSVSLMRTDGTLIMREPFDPRLLGTTIKPHQLFEHLAERREGEYQARSVIDGVDRLHHYQRVGTFDLVQTVSLSVDDIYADWWRKAVGASAVLAASCAIIVTLALMLRNELRRRRQAEAALVTLAAEDGLTTLANRRHFDEVLDEELRRAVRHGWPLALLIIDADHFKSYNDTLGHVAGDDALKALAGCLKNKARRSGDLAARYGGEEFALVFPHTDADVAMQLAEAIRLDVAGLGLDNPGSPLRKLSVSIGVAAVKPEPGVTAADLIETADSALYAAKTEGRNRCRLLRTLKPRPALTPQSVSRADPTADLVQRSA